MPLGLLTAALLNQSMKRLPPAGRRHKLDFLGAALVMAAATLFLLALTTGGTRVPWLSPTIFALIGASILLTVVVGWWLKRAPEPFLPLNVLANPVMKLGTAATSFAMAVMTGFMIYMPLYFQTVHKLTPTQAGPRAHPGDRDDHAGLDGVRPRDDASQPLQALALCRHGGGDAGGRGAGGVAGHAGAVGGDRDRRGRLRRRHRVPDRHRLRAERGVAARGRHRDRRA